MIKYKDIAFVAYGVSDMGKARAFYEGVLGLKPNSEYQGKEITEFVEYEVGPSTLAIGKADMWPPSEDGASVALEVEDFDEALLHIKEHDISIKMGPYDFPGCRMVVILDPDKNKLTLHHKK
ncbi:MAG: VOC family protein [Candidatus Paceibacterota bacterium]|jgi:predicted enzyme related to lactoylglutathione lyase